MADLRYKHREDDKMNGYKAFYKGKSVEVYALTSYEAQVKAAKELKAKKEWDVTVMLCEREGAEIEHSAVII
jgi:hypothetical protein